MHRYSRSVKEYCIVIITVPLKITDDCWEPHKQEKRRQANKTEKMTTRVVDTSFSLSEHVINCHHPYSDVSY